MAAEKGIEEIRAVRDRHEKHLLKKKNVVGLGIGYKEVEGQKTEQLSLVVMVRKKELPSQLDATDLVPSEIEGVPVDVKAVGEIVALSSGNLSQRSAFLEGQEKDLEPVIKVKRRNVDYLLSRRNVVACGVGLKEVEGGITDEPCVVVSVTKKMPEEQLSPADIVPKKLGEVRTDVQETGVIRALVLYPLSLGQRTKGDKYRALQDHTDRWRPAPGGVSIGHVDITGGTLGCLVTRGDHLFILANNHVLANSNAAEKRDPIIQPGRYDGGTLDDRIATLEDFIPLNFGAGPPSCSIATGVESFLNSLAKLLGSSHRVMAFQELPEANRVDAAIARPLSDDLVEKRILVIGVPKGSRDATLGTRVKKSGRTSGFTTGEIIQIDVTAQVSYGGAKIAIFEDQLMAGAMSKGGDSGAAVLDEEDFVIGLLFAGSYTTTIINPIRFVLDALNVEIAV